MKENEEKLFIQCHEDKLAVLLNQPKQSNGIGVVLLHCFLCTKYHKIMRNLAEALSENGVTTLRFDFSGNGESSGAIEETTYTKMINQVKTITNFMFEKGIKNVVLAGHSMGAMIALLAGAEDKRISEVIFIAGSSETSRVREIFPKEAIEKVENGEEVDVFVYGREIKLKKKFLDDIKKYDLKKFAEKLKRPLVIIHGFEDETISISHARLLYNLAHEPKKLIELKNTDHLFTKNGNLDELKKIVVQELAGIKN